VIQVVDDNRIGLKNAPRWGKTFLYLTMLFLLFTGITLWYINQQKIYDYGYCDYNNISQEYICCRPATVCMNNDCQTRFDNENKQCTTLTNITELRIKDGIRN